MGPQPSDCERSGEPGGENNHATGAAARQRNRQLSVEEVAISAHDAAAANRALELLGKAAEVQLFSENAAPHAAPPVEDTAHKECVERLVKRYSTPLKVIEGGAGSSKKAADGERG